MNLPPEAIAKLQKVKDQMTRDERKAQKKGVKCR